MSANPHTPNEDDLDAATQRAEEAAESILEATAATEDATVEAEGAAPGGAGEAASDGREAALEAELAEVKERLDQALRALAEAQNAQRRAQQEGEKNARFAIQGFARDILAIADNLRRALDAVPEEARHAGEGMEKLVEGVEMTERELHNTLNRHGVQPVEAVGRLMDPNLHRAVFEVEDSSVPKGTIVQEVQTGYVLNDRLLREAMVGVAKGGPRPEPAAGGNGETPGPGGVDTTV